MFVRLNDISRRSIPIGIAMLQAVLKQNGHTVRIFDSTFMTSKVFDVLKKREELGFYKPVDLSRYTKVKNCNINEELLKAISDFNPGLIGISIMSNDFESLKDSSAVIKKKFPHIPLLIGGIHPTVAPDHTFECKDIDMICVGEGEDAMVELLSRMEKRQNLTDIKNIWVRKEGKIYRNELRPFIDLNKLPPPDCTGFSQMHLYRPFWGKIYRIMDVETSRGCVHNCSECINASLKEMYRGKGRYHREKSTEKAIADLKCLKDKYNIKMFRFQDEILFVWSVDKCRKFFELYKREIALPFICFGRAEYMTEEKVKIFRDSGCVSVSIGVETGNPELRARVLNRRMKNRKIIEAFQLCNKYKIRTGAFYMLGLPEEKRSDIFDSIMLNRECNPSLTTLTFVYPFHGTPLREYCLEKGYINDNDPIVDYVDSTIIKNDYISKERQKGLFRTFILYTLIPKWMFPLVFICEYDSLFSNYLRRRLIKTNRDKLIRRLDAICSPIQDTTKTSLMFPPNLDDF